MNMRLVEFCETVRVGGHTYQAGARDHFPTAVADRYIRLGWCKDPETGEQGERRPGANGPVVPDSTRTVSRASEA